MIKNLIVALALAVMFAGSANADLFNSYPPALAASQKDHKTLIVLIGAENW